MIIKESQLRKVIREILLENEDPTQYMKAHDFSKLAPDDLKTVPDQASKPRLVGRTKISRDEGYNMLKKEAEIQAKNIWNKIQNDELLNDYKKIHGMQLVNLTFLRMLIKELTEYSRESDDKGFDRAGSRFFSSKIAKSS